MPDFYAYKFNMKRKFEKYYNKEIKNRIYQWCPTNLIEWCNIDENKLFDILEDLCKQCYADGYLDGEL